MGQDLLVCGISGWVDVDDIGFENWMIMGSWSYEKVSKINYTLGGWRDRLQIASNTADSLLDLSLVFVCLLNEICQS